LIVLVLAVVSFAGDALLCVFPVVSSSFSYGSERSRSIHSIEEACEMALQCAFQMRQHTIHSLSAHFAVSCGSVQFALLGGVQDEWVYLMSGECITDLATYIDIAQPKQVVCSRECADNAFHSQGITLELATLTQDAVLIKSIVSSTSNKSSNQTLSSTVQSRNLLLLEDVEVLNRFLAKANYFIPRPVQNALFADSLSNIAELRRITVMFLKLESFSTESCPDILSLQPFFVLFQEILAYSGGFLRQFLVDDKGCVAIAMWGVPSYTHSNDCSRGLYCAWNILTKAAVMNHKCSIGLTAGYAYCGIIGSSIRRDYVCMGDKVNMAARLMSKAKGRVLVDPDIYPFISYDERKNLMKGEQLLLKGMSDAIIPYFFTPSADLSNLQFYDEDKTQSIIRKDVVQKLLFVLDSVSSAHTNIPFLSTLAVDNSHYHNSDLKSTILVGHVDAAVQSTGEGAKEHLSDSGSKQNSTEHGEVSSELSRKSGGESGRSPSKRLSSMLGFANGLLSGKKSPGVSRSNVIDRTHSNGESTDLTPNQTPRAPQSLGSSPAQSGSGKTAIRLEPLNSSPDGESRVSGRLSGRNSGRISARECLRV
jgi:class 3 adenylate cyclase